MIRAGILAPIGMAGFGVFLGMAPAQTDPLASAIQLAGVIMGALAGAGIFVLVWKAAWMLRDMKSMIDATSKALEGFSARVLEMLEDHEGRIHAVEVVQIRNGAVYDGPERRHPHKET